MSEYQIIPSLKRDKTIKGGKINSRLSLWFAHLGLDSAHCPI
jgi:hypothetical protein